eukprot:scaffold154992_cov30-Tisochrysis_lutea.AAC.3
MPSIRADPFASGVEVMRELFKRHSASSRPRAWAIALGRRPADEGAVDSRSPPAQSYATHRPCSALSNGSRRASTAAARVLSDMRQWPPAGTSVGATPEHCKSSSLSRAWALRSSSSTEDEMHDEPSEMCATLRADLTAR